MTRLRIFDTTPQDGEPREHFSEAPFQPRAG